MELNEVTICHRTRLTLQHITIMHITEFGLYLVGMVWATRHYEVALERFLL
jgi:hypothetical protein